MTSIMPRFAADTDPCTTVDKRFDKQLLFTVTKCPADEETTSPASTLISTSSTTWTLALLDFCRLKEVGSRSYEINNAS
jgi:hypothetical protein